MLVTIGLKCYNNVAYIRAAIESVLSQTYRPLEVVISDDGSDDGSWEVIRDVLDHRRRDTGMSVVVNRNESNLGNLGNWEKICALAHGDWIVKADGDDISDPTRVARISACVKDRPDVYVVGHGGGMIGKKGEALGEMPRACKTYVIGAAMAFRRDCFTRFGPSQVDLHVVDDEIYARRGMLLGTFLSVPEKLVKYRVGTGVSNALWQVREPMLRCAKNMLVSLEQSEKDGWDVSDERAQAEARVLLIAGRTWRDRRKGALRVRDNTGVWKFLKFAFVLPRIPGEPLLRAYALVRYCVRRIDGLRQAT